MVVGRKNIFVEEVESKDGATNAKLSMITLECMVVGRRTIFIEEVEPKNNPLICQLSATTLECTVVVRRKTKITAIRRVSQRSDELRRRSGAKGRATNAKLSVTTLECTVVGGRKKEEGYNQHTELDGQSSISDDAREHRNKFKERP